MAVQQMKKIHLCAWKSSRGNILEMLQRRGIVQIASLKRTGILSAWMRMLCAAAMKKKHLIQRGYWNFKTAAFRRKKAFSRPWKERKRYPGKSTGGRPPGSRSF